VLIAAAPRLGEILVARKLIEPEDLERALELQRERSDRLGKIMVDMGLLAQRDLLAIVAEQLGIPMAVIGEPPALPETEGLATDFMREFRFLPVSFDGRDHAAHRDERSAGSGNHQRGAELHRARSGSRTGW
jgi:hypothetical protein